MAQSAFAGELEATRFTVKKILELAQRGELRVPPFQRPFRWRRPDHLLLLDSLYRGYPVGTLLLWRRKADAAAVTFGEFSTQAAAMNDALWIVDGQQRITSMVGCFLRPEMPSGRRTSEFAFWFDLEADQFLVGSGVLENRYIPVNRLWDPVLIGKWAREVGADDRSHDRAQAVGARLRTYEIPAYVTHAESDELLRIIFDRANTAGKQMRREEVFEALNIGLNPLDSPQGLTERLRDGVRSLGFGTVGHDDLQRALICVAGFNPQVSLPEALRAPGAASVWESATAEGLRRTVMFLRDEARIPHARAMPYVLPFILLPRFFHLYPNPGERTVELLVRWVWRGIAGQTHMATNQQFNPHFKALRSSSEEAVAQAFLGLVTRNPPTTVPLSDLYNLRGMKTKLDLAALFSLAPRSVETAYELSPMEVFEAELPEDPSLFSPAPRGEGGRRVAPGPVLVLPRLPGEDPSSRSQIGARLLHPEIRGGDRAFAEALRRVSSETLRSHGIDSNMELFVRRGAWAELVQSRTELTHALVRRTILELARWGEDDDGPSIEASLADGELDGDA